MNSLINESPKVNTLASSTFSNVFFSLKWIYRKPFRSINRSSREAESCAQWVAIMDGNLVHSLSHRTSETSIPPLISGRSIITSDVRLSILVMGGSDLPDNAFLMKRSRAMRTRCHLQKTGVWFFFLFSECVRDMDCREDS